ncbi:MAG: AraC family transcriptional regulator [Salinisphaeraceae bacterium]|nr:AraC family transcriptional regulator [Salinisphaeraceae bacterium]
MKDPYGLHRRTLPVTYPQIVMDIAADSGITAQAILEAAALPIDLLENGSGYISPWQYTLIHISAAHLLGNPGLGMELGLRMRPTAHGFLGYAVIACSSLREALQLSLRFMCLRQRHIQAEYFREKETGVVRLKETHSFGPVRHFFIEGMLIGVARTAQYLVDDNNLDHELWLDYPEPEYFKHYRQSLPQLRFDMPEVRIEFRESDLDRPLRMTDPVASKQAIEQCEHELARLGDSTALALQVRSILEDNIQTPPKLEDIANQLFMSPRSLKRKLQSQGSSYQKILDDIRFVTAKRLLQNQGLGIQLAGEELGYTEPASFTRAFRKWAGMTPSQYRKQHESEMK